MASPRRLFTRTVQKAPLQYGFIKMNVLCAMCPIGIVCDAFCPSVDKTNSAIERRSAEVSKENSRLREIMIENGLTYGAGEQGNENNNTINQ